MYDSRVVRLLQAVKITPPEISPHFADTPQTRQCVEDSMKGRPIDCREIESVKIP
jgi:hypothetical protein